MNVTEYIANVLPKMEGWCTPEKATKLAEYAKNARLFVEIGVFGGRSLFAVALAQPNAAIAIGIDPWKADASVKGFEDENAKWWGRLDHEAIYQKCRTVLDTLNLNANCHLLRCTANDAALLIRRIGFIELLHIDGNHSEASALADVENYVPLVPPGGIVFLDDVDWATTKQAQLRLEQLCAHIDSVGTCGIYRRREPM